mmetsp:Transcript_12107/g.14081  ORF Transcript_12107/g.14081 Transcript_12107/m.14081 type:complete len:90 (-) Transcript_12107:734-1003(-)
MLGEVEDDDDDEFGRTTVEDYVLFEKYGVEHLLLCLELYVQSQVSNTSCILYGPTCVTKKICRMWYSTHYIHAIPTTIHDITFLYAKCI